MFVLFTASPSTFLSGSRKVQGGFNSTGFAFHRSNESISESTSPRFESQIGLDHVFETQRPLVVYSCSGIFYKKRMSLKQWSKDEGRHNGHPNMHLARRCVVVPATGDESGNPTIAQARDGFPLNTELAI
jgi:hypothetical protein